MSKWNDINKRRIKELYAVTSNKELAEIFNTTVKSIEGIAVRLELKKYKETLSKILKESQPKREHAPMLEHKGILYIYMPEHPSCNCRGYVAKHRLIMEKKLNRYLKDTEAVMHKNGDKNDNELENLEIKYYYKSDVSPIDIYNDWKNEVPIKETKEKYRISNNTYYRKLKKGAELNGIEDFECTLSPIHILKDKESGMSVKELLAKYDISTTTYYRKIKKAKKFNESIL